MALKSGNLRRSLRHTDSGAIDETIIESEQTLDYTFDGDYNYLQEGQSHFISASGVDSTISSGSITYAIKGIVASGSGISGGLGVLDFVAIAISGDGLSSTSGSQNLTLLKKISASGINTTDSFSDLSFLLKTSASGLSETVSNATIGYILTINASSFGFGNKEEALLGKPIDISGLSFGEGFGVEKLLTSSPSGIVAQGISSGKSFVSNLGIEGKTEEELEKRAESYFIGDVEIPLLIARDLSVDRNTEAKHFVDADSQFFQESANYERGTFSAVLNQDQHSEGKTLEQQTDDLQKLLDRIPQENKIEYADGTAYLAVQSISDAIDVDQNIREVEMDVILLESTEFSNS